MEGVGAEGVPREALRASRETLANGCGCERKIRTRDSTCSGALSEERGVVCFVLLEGRLSMLGRRCNFQAQGPNGRLEIFEP